MRETRPTGAGQGWGGRGAAASHRSTSKHSYICRGQGRGLGGATQQVPRPAQATGGAPQLSDEPLRSYKRNHGHTAKRGCHTARLHLRPCAWGVPPPQFRSQTHLYVLKLRPAWLRRLQNRLLGRAICVCAAELPPLQTQPLCGLQNTARAVKHAVVAIGGLVHLPAPHSAACRADHRTTAKVSLLLARHASASWLCVIPQLR